MQHLPAHSKWIFFFVILLVALGIAAPVLADYLGPNRTVTTTVSVCQAVLYECKEVNGHWKYKRMQDWSCPNYGDACAGYPSNSRPCSDESNVPGWEYCKKEESTQTTTVTYDPATISGSVQNCTLQNGWCVSPPNLSLSANEPLSGYSITLIEGTLNGATFACPAGAASCGLPLNEGENNFNYWALSSWGDSSAMGTSSARVDTVAPNVGLDISGTSGANGWYVSPLTITATGDDAMPGSGVASRLLSLDGGATWQPSVTLNEGVYQVDVTVFDYAGNVSTSSATLSVDTTTPSIDVAVSGTQGNNNYYKSAIQVSAVPTDATSGVAAFAVAVDGAAYQVYTAPISFSDGQHTIQFKACDAAGNCTETPLQTFLVDTIPPLVNLPASWQLGTNVPYDVWDEGSGLAALRIVIEDEDEKFKKVAWDQAVSGCTFSEDIDWNGEFKDKTVAPPGTYLVWLKASDLAGNEKFYLGKVIVPEPVGFLNLFQPTEPSLASPEPPAELIEPEAAPPVTEAPALGFGGETTQPGEVTKQSLLLATGSAGAAKSSSSSSSILWGAMAVAAISAASAYAFEATRKRKEAEEAQAARVRAEIAQDKAERAKKQQKQKENYEKQKALEQAILAYQQKKKQEAAYNARMEEKMTNFEKQEETAWVAVQAAIKAKQEEKKKAEEAAAKQAAMLASLPGFSSEKQYIVHNPRPPKSKGLPGADFAAQIVKGVQDFSAKTINWVNQKAEDGKQWAQTKYDEAKETVKQKLEETKQLVQTKVEETKKDLKEKWENLTVPKIVRERAYQLYKTLPSAGLTNERNTIPVFRIPAGRLISLGLVESQDASTDGNPHARIDKDGFSTAASYKSISTELAVNTDKPAITMTARVASPVNLEEERGNANLGYSAIAGLQFNHIYDATVSLDVNFVDLGIDTPDVGKGNVRSGVYVEMNVWVATAVVITTVVLLLTPVDEILATLGLIGAGISTGIATGIDKVQKVIEMLKGFQPIPPTLIPK